MFHDTVDRVKEELPDDTSPVETEEYVNDKVDDMNGKK